MLPTWLTCRYSSFTGPRRTTCTHNAWRAERRLARYYVWTTTLWLNGVTNLLLSLFFLFLTIFILPAFTLAILVTVIPAADPCANQSQLQCIIEGGIYLRLSNSWFGQCLARRNFITIAELCDIEAFASNSEKRMCIFRVSHVAVSRLTIGSMQFIHYRSSSTGKFYERRSGGYSRCRESASYGVALTSDVVQQRLCQHEILGYNSMYFDWFFIQKNQILDAGSEKS